MGDKWVLVWVNDGGDFYVGETAAIYKDGTKVWEGFSNDAVEDIVRLFVGDDLDVRGVSYRRYREGSYFPDDLADVRDDERPARDDSPVGKILESIYGPAIKAQVQTLTILGGGR